MTPPRSLVTGVLVSPAVCAELDHLVVRLVAEARRDGWTLSSDAEDVLEGVQLAAKASRSATLSRQATPGLSALSTPKVENVGWVSVPDAAKRLGVSPQAVTERCRVGSWKDVATKDDAGHWQIPVTALPKETESA